MGSLAVPEIAHSSPKPSELDESAIASLARKTSTPIEVVRHLYDEERAELQGTSSVKNFIDVIAGRRVRERLMRPRFRNKGQPAAATAPQ